VQLLQNPPLCSSTEKSKNAASQGDILLAPSTWRTIWDHQVTLVVVILSSSAKDDLSQVKFLWRRMIAWKKARTQNHVVVV
jgi:hypothetical protein